MPKSKKENILITGGNGQLAKTFNYINIDQHKIIIPNKKLLDITSTNNCKKYFKKYKPKFIINTAAFTDVGLAELKSKKAFKINYEGVLNLVKLSKKYDSILIHISTDYVFDGKKNSHYLESDKCYPINEYGKSKLAGELIIKKNLKKYYIFRVSWLFGYGKNNFVKKIIKNLISYDQVSVVTDEFSSPTSSIDLVNLIKYIITERKIKYGLYHFNSYNKKISRFSFAKMISKILLIKGFSVAKISQTYINKSIRPKNTFLSTNKIYKHINYTKKRFKSNLNTMIEYYIKEFEK